MKVKNIAVIATAMVSQMAIAESVDSYPFEVGMALDQSLSAVIRVDDKVNVVLGNDGVAVDYFLKTGQFDTEEPASWYVGVGGWNEWGSDKSFGVRVPLGINYQIVDNWKGYAQIHPELDMNDGLELGIGAAIGIMYRF